MNDLRGKTLFLLEKSKRVFPRTPFQKKKTAKLNLDMIAAAFV